jgi:hypothetical protein
MGSLTRHRLGLLRIKTRAPRIIVALQVRSCPRDLLIHAAAAAGGVRCARTLYAQHADVDLAACFRCRRADRSRATALVLQPGHSGEPDETASAS